MLLGPFRRRVWIKQLVALGVNWSPRRSPIVIQQETSFIVFVVNLFKETVFATANLLLFVVMRRFCQLLLMSYQVGIFS